MLISSMLALKGLGKAGKWALGSALSAGAGTLGYMGLKKVFDRPDMKRTGLTGGANKTIDSAYNAYDDADEKSMGLVRGATYGAAAGLGAYVLGRYTGANKYVAKLFGKDKSFLEALPKYSRYMELKRSPKEWAQFKEAYIKKHGPKAWDKFEDGIKKYTSIEGEYGKYKDMDLGRLEKINPKIFGAEKGANMLGREIEAKINQLSANKQIPLTYHPALKRVVGNRYEKRPANEVYNEFMQNLALPVLKDLRAKAFEGGVREFDEKGRPLYGFEKDIHSKDTILGNATQTFNPYSLYKQRLNKIYQNQIYNGNYNESVFKRPVDDWADTGQEIEDNMKNVEVPPTHPFLEPIEGYEGHSRQYMMPKQQMNRRQLREWFGRKFNDYGDMTDQQFAQVAAYRMLGGRKLDKEGKVKTKEIFADGDRDVEVESKFPGFRRDAVFPWNNEVLAMGDETPLMNEDKNSYGLNVGDIKGYTVPKTMMGRPIPSVTDQYPTEFKKTLDEFDPRQLHPFYRTAQGEENSLSEIGKRKDVFRAKVNQTRGMKKEAYNKFIKESNLKVNEAARSLQPWIDRPLLWNDRQTGGSGKGGYAFTPEGRKMYTPFVAKGRRVDMENTGGFMDPKAFKGKYFNPATNPLAQRAFNSANALVKMPALFENYGQAFLDRFGPQSQVTTK